MALTDLDQNSRFEKSLGLLTTRFVNLLQEAEDGVLDLKVVCDKMLGIYIENYLNLVNFRLQTLSTSGRREGSMTLQMFLRA